jgi:hypothetical protein
MHVHAELKPKVTTRQRAQFRREILEEILRQAVYEQDEDGRWNASIPAIPGCRSRGRTKEEARARIRMVFDFFTRDNPPRG